MNNEQQIKQLEKDLERLRRLPPSTTPRRAGTGNPGREAVIERKERQIQILKEQETHMNSDHVPRFEHKHTQPTAIKTTQEPEIYLAVDLETMAKGGYKKTIKCSVRVFDGNPTALYKHLEDALETGFAIANETIRQQEENEETEGKRD